VVVAEFYAQRQLIMNMFPGAYFDHFEPTEAAKNFAFGGNQAAIRLWLRVTKLTISHRKKPLNMSNY